MLVKEIAEQILKDPEFVDDIKESLDKILKDGKIDMSDVPEVILLVTLGYNKSKKFNRPHLKKPKIKYVEEGRGSLID